MNIIYKEITLDLLKYGFNPAMMPEDREEIPARITAVHKDRFEIVCEKGIIHARLKAGKYYNDSDESFPTAGDFVLIRHNESGDSLITETLERKSLFSRNDFKGHAPGYVKTIKEQVVAANFDYVFIMASLNNDFNIRRIERYLTLAWQSGAVPAIILTKADMVDDYTEYVRQLEKVAWGVGVFAISSVTGEGLDQLGDYLKPQKTIVLLGSSGVGKSTFVNALAGKEVMDVKEIRDDDSRGRHTTTHRRLIMLPDGYMIIDTPGMRELGMWDVDTGLKETFSDVESYLGLCRFSDCRHDTEPGCAIKQAIEDGELSEERWISYLQLKKEMKFVDDKAGYLRDKDARFKEIARINKNKKKTSGYTK